MCFIFSCTNRNLRPQWEILTKAKIQILDLAFSDETTLGIKLAALKFMQRVILVQTRGVTDPRVCIYNIIQTLTYLPLEFQLQNKADPNLAFCPSDHPFMSTTQMEAEGTKLLEKVITLFFSTKYVLLFTSL